MQELDILATQQGRCTSQPTRLPLQPRYNPQLNVPPAQPPCEAGCKDSQQQQQQQQLGFSSPAAQQQSFQYIAASQPPLKDSSPQATAPGAAAAQPPDAHTHSQPQADSHQQRDQAQQLPQQQMPAYDLSSEAHNQQLVPAGFVHDQHDSTRLNTAEQDPKAVQSLGAADPTGTAVPQQDLLGQAQQSPAGVQAAGTVSLHPQGHQVPLSRRTGLDVARDPELLHELQHLQGDVDLWSDLEVRPCN